MGTTAFNKYPEDCKFNGKKVLNLGCGFAQFTAPNVVNLDGEECSNAQVIWNLGSPEPLPFPDESFDFILANHILEHVPNWWHAFEECARLLKPGGTLEVWGPGMGSDSVLGFRDHINTINQCSFWGINDFSKNPNNAWAASNAKGPAAQLKLKQMAIRLYEKEHWWIRLAPAWLKTWMAHHLRNVIHEVGFEFVKVHSEPVFNNAIVEALL